MGNSQTMIQKHPDIAYYDQIVSATFLETDDNGNTIGLMHSEFRNNVLQANNCDISREKNPFCPLVMGNNDNWITCCFISPIMLIASPLYLMNKEGYLDKQLTIKTIYNDEEHTIKVSEAVSIQPFYVCVLILSEPCYFNGWVGISYIESLDDLKQYAYPLDGYPPTQLKMVNHPQFYLNKQKNAMVHTQRIKPYHPTATISTHHPMALEYFEDISGTLIFKIENQKPYVIGIQSSENQTMFFRKQTIEAMKKVAKLKAGNKFNQQHLMENLNKGLYGTCVMQ